MREGRPFGPAWPFRHEFGPRHPPPSPRVESGGMRDALWAAGREDVVDRCGRRTRARPRPQVRRGVDQRVQSPRISMGPSQRLSTASGPSPAVTHRPKRALSVEGLPVPEPLGTVHGAAPPRSPLWGGPSPRPAAEAEQHGTSARRELPLTDDGGYIVTISGGRHKWLAAVGLVLPVLLVLAGIVQWWRNNRR